MHDGMQYDPIQRQGQDSRSRLTSPSKSEILLFSKAISSAIYNESWQLTTDS